MDDAQTAAEAHADKAQGGLASGGYSDGNVAQLLGYQYAARNNYRREEAMQLALQANAGAPLPIDALLANADKILTWLETPNPSGT